MDKVLEGVKVIDFSSYAAGPWAGRILAEMGADVIKVESPKGDAHRSFGFFIHTICEEDENPCYLVENAGKRDIAIDLKTPEGKQVLFDLLKEANIFFTNTRMQTLEAMGLTYEDLKDKFPHLIYGHLSGYGLKGPDAGLPGYDSTAYFGRVGDLIDMAFEGSGPLALTYGVGDNTTGTALALGLVAALHKQMKTGEGSYVLVSLYGAAIGMHALTLIASQEGEGYDEYYPKSRMEPPTPVCNTYLTKDGAINISLLKHEKFWPGFCRAIEKEEWIDDERYNTREASRLPENNAALVTALTEIFKQETSAFWAERLAKEDLPMSVCQHYRDIQYDEQAWANGYLSKYTYPNGHEGIVPSIPVQFGENKANPIVPPAGVGENTAEILSEIGYDEEKIRHLQEIKAVV